VRAWQKPIGEYSHSLVTVTELLRDGEAVLNRLDLLDDRVDLSRAKAYTLRIEYTVGAEKERNRVSRVGEPDTSRSSSPTEHGHSSRERVHLDPIALRPNGLLESLKIGLAVPDVALVAPKANGHVGEGLDL
jgi:hypothetical protein